MNKKIRRLAALLLCLAVMSGSLSVFAAQEEPAAEGETISISCKDDFLRFAEACRLDSYSRSLTVQLCADLDLSGTDFSGVPVFCGTFLGGGHTVSGLAITRDGSMQGLFRTLGDSALICDLTVQGRVEPAGSRSMTGGIAGKNAGIIRGCSFEGTVSGAQQTGGIAGSNTVTGCIEDCTVSGVISGDHFAGGIAGDNSGIVRRCENRAGINVTEEQNRLDLADISLHTITGTEAAHTVTDIGGIAGTSCGVIRECRNTGDVGYPHIGYNLGGIAGSQTGLIADCTNSGAVYGRKEAGGIAGQCEPVQQVSFEEDTLQILQQQMFEAAALADQTAAGVIRGSAAVQEQGAAMRGHADAAASAILQLLPDRENGFPDADAVQAARNSLSSSVSAMNGLMQDMTVSAKENADRLSDEISALSRKMSEIGRTVGSAEDHLGARVTDISDRDTPEDLNGKVTGCLNLGRVEADINAGGIAGAVSWENDWDPEDELAIRGKRSLNFDGELRAVIRDCENRGEIASKKRQAGGIAGLASCGLIRGCISTGNICAKSAACAGGIAGSSSGWIRNCSTKCEIEAKSSAGGIAGSACRASDCLSVVCIAGCREKSGAVLGECTEPHGQEDETDEPPVIRNYYLPAGTDPGGIDGISYDGAAAPLDTDEFLQAENLPLEFAVSELIFRTQDGSETVVSVPLGEPLREEDIPAVPKQDGSIGSWEGLDETDLSHIYLDRIIPVHYENHRTVLRSSETRGSGAAILLAEGEFCESASVALQKSALRPPEEDRIQCIESWAVPEFSGELLTRLHISCPDGTDPEHISVMVQSASGSWRTAAAQQKGKYLVFDVLPDDRVFALMQTPEIPVWLFAAAGGVLLLILILIFVMLRRRKRKIGKSRRKTA